MRGAQYLQVWVRHEREGLQMGLPVTLTDRTTSCFGTTEGPPAGPRREPASGGGQGGPLSGEPVLEDLQLVPHRAGELLAELLEPLGDLRDLLAPLVLVDGEGLLHLLGGHVQARDVEGV